MATTPVPGSSLIRWLRWQTGGRPAGSVKMPANCSRSSSMATTKVAARTWGTVDDSEAVQMMRRPLWMNTNVRRCKSKRTGPSDSSH
jgi:hypothetical protein